MRKLLVVVQQDYPDDAILINAQNAFDADGFNSLVAASEASSGAGARESVYSWLLGPWRKGGPCVCCLQGLSGVGKTHTAERLMASGVFEGTVLIETPIGADLEQILLLVSEHFDRYLDVSLPAGADLSDSILRVLKRPILVVLDEFQNCLTP
ncbi:MAG TPA: hypothetical protein VFP72_09625, partial [Kineosporiaceae bacterium]|nr:hypothetical protein [Kineosporiaceae bacterium]